MGFGTRTIRTAFVRWLITGIAASALLAAWPQIASGAGTGSISGTVIDAQGDPAPGVCVEAYDANGQGFNSLAYVGTDSSGEYSIEGLDTGSYRVRFNPCGANVLREWFDDEHTFAGATSIPVTDGVDSPGIDAQLAKGGSISGRVLNAPGSGPDSGTCVDAYLPGGFPLESTSTKPDGTYEVLGLETGEYIVRFDRCASGENIAREYFPDKAAASEATLVSVTAGSDTPAIDAQLEKGVTVSGTLTPIGPPFAPYLCSLGVSALDVDGVQVNQETLDFSSATPTGGFGYTLKKLKPGSKYVLSANVGCFWPPDSSFSRTEFYRDAETLGGASPISTGSLTAITGMDIDMRGPDPVPMAPDTVIDSGPSGTISQNEATFTFSSTDPANTSGFQCKLDSGEFADCSSPKTFSALSDGVHTFSVRAQHVVAGFEDQTPATRTFTVDTSTPPVRRARITKVSVKGPARIKLGRKATYRVRITNSGQARAKNLKVVVKGRGVRLTRRAGTVASRSTKTVKLTLKPRRAGKGKLTFKVSSANGGGRIAKRAINVLRSRR